MRYVFKTEDDPEVRMDGGERYAWTFHLDEGGELTVYCGMETIRQMVNSLQQIEPAVLRDIQQHNEV